MKTKIRTRPQIVKHEILLRLKQEKTLICLFITALVYSLISNIISKFCPIECDVKLANIGNTIDELLRNICYSILAGVIFYLINDLYKNVVKRVYEIDQMFHELLNLQLRAWNFLSTIGNNKYDRNMSREQAFQCIMKNICNEDVEFNIMGSFLKFHAIEVGDCVTIVDKWRELNKMQATFLVTYGDLLERKEILILNRCNDYSVSEIIDYLNFQLENTHEEFVQVREHDIALVVNRIIGYKIYLTDLAKKYIHYNYSRSLYLRRQCVVADFG